MLKGIDDVNSTMNAVAQVLFRIHRVPIDVLSAVTWALEAVSVAPIGVLHTGSWSVLPSLWCEISGLGVPAPGTDCVLSGPDRLREPTTVKNPLSARMKLESVLGLAIVL